MKVAHISDVHFFSPKFKWSHFCSTKWLGYFNALFTRRSVFITDYLDQFISSLKDEGVSALIITGDFTTITEKEEFTPSKAFVDKVRAEGVDVYLIPGNHDVYTKKSFCEKYFYEQMDTEPGNVKLITLNENWDLILLDTTQVNSLGYANGFYSERIEEELKPYLSSPKNLIVANHFPFFEEKGHRRLHRGLILKQSLIDTDKPVIYLHGHTHKTEHSKERNLDTFNSSQVTVNGQFKYHVITLNENNIDFKQVKYHG